MIRRIAYRIAHDSLKRAISITQKDAYLLAIFVRHREIEVSIAVQIACRNRLWVLPDRIVHGPLESAVAIAYKNVNLIVPLTCSSEVDNAVAIQVPGRDRR